MSSQTETEMKTFFFMARNPLNRSGLSWKIWKVQRTGMRGLRLPRIPFPQTALAADRSLVPYAWPSQKAMQTVREKIRQQTERTRLRVDLGELVGGLNRIITG